MGVTDPLRVLEENPYNAEPRFLAELTDHAITPLHLVYDRNHSVITDLRSVADNYSVTIDGEIDGIKGRALTLAQVRNDFVARDVVATLICAGNRRAKMAQKTGKRVQGVNWSEGTIANVRWTGAPLRDILRAAGVSDDNTSWEGLHVCFASHIAPCDKAEWYGVSISLEKAMHEDGDVLLAYEMNGVPLTPGHGFPLRVVVPGYYGMRWVKWVDRITVSRVESPNFFQQKDYKILPESVTSMEMATAQGWWSKVPCMQNLDCNSVVTRVEQRRGGSPLDLVLEVHGYAYSDCPIQHVDISVDDGSTWYGCEIKYQDGPWSWAIWECVVDLMADEDNVNSMLLARDMGDGEKRGVTVTVLSRARDSRDRVQLLTCAWNLRGVGYSGAGEATLDVHMPTL